MTRPDVLALLAKAVSFPTVSAASNLGMIAWLEELLAPRGFACTRLASADGAKCGLVARLGPNVEGGLLLAAHTDVVPAEGQSWASDPFVMSQRGTRLFGRGTADMKGFLACALAAALDAAEAPRTRPLTLVFSYDEEVGCTGVRDMLPRLAPLLGKPALCLVGEPTLLTPATGHKGKVVYEMLAQGAPGHSAMAPLYCNALHIAADAVSIIRNAQARLRQSGARDTDYQVPYSTLHVGALSGGGPVNLVPHAARLVFECRHLPGDDVDAIIAGIESEVGEAVAALKHPAAGVTFNRLNAYPGFAIAAHSPAVQAVAQSTGSNSTLKVDYGTEAGYYASLGIATVVCGPGSMAQGHQPDEFIELEQLQLGEAWLSRLIAQFA
ncbi:MAG: acetylornithine deacetylase [Alphaproteobacteria bacterium]|nr:acetylornithine deacetylase [Alphaproteobacteria bacterium]